MPKCSICKEEKEELFECKECGQTYCKDCGNVKDKYCEDCKEHGRTKEELEQEKEIIDDIQDMEQESKD